MASNRSNDDAPTLISIQINGEKTARVRSVLSISVADFRASLTAQDVHLPPNVLFLDAEGYPVSVINETSSNIRDLLVSTSDGQTIKLRTREPTTNIVPTNVVPQPSTTKLIMKLILLMVTLSFAYYMRKEDNRKSILCPVFAQMNNTILLDKFNCLPVSDPSPPDNDTYTDTMEFLKQQIMKDANGAEVLVNTKKGLQKVELKDVNEHFVSIYDDWIKNETTYKADYEWYNGMVSECKHCPGHFDEKVMNSDNIIRDTTESIQQFTSDEFQDWPQKIRVKLNIENRLKSTMSDDGDVFSLDNNGKIGSNMYLAAWKREPDDTIRIQTYVTIFERTAGEDCHFKSEYWSGHRDRITNAKKYYLLTKVKTNPAFKNFLMSIPRI